jgi:hypothetical protein
MGWIDQMISIIGTSKICQFASVIAAINNSGPRSAQCL